MESTGRAKRKISDRFRIFATRTADRLGSHWAFVLAVGVIAGWLISGPVFHFSNAWQLVINTATTVITFLMVFLIQTTQNRDAKAIHLKLDELIRSSRARNVFADLEDATEAELAEFKEEFRKLREKHVESGAAAEEAHRRVHVSGSH
ncbi:MAG TPA: low affinity iron permease family protein [Polyangia bacterium]|nr:low affinity iron permease family protein [Polyangia bacterium]